MAAVSSIVSGIIAVGAAAAAAKQGKDASDKARTDQEYMVKQQEENQRKIEKMNADQAAKSEAQADLGKKKIKQRAAAAQYAGRSSTILTSPMAPADQGASTQGQKTLLGL